MATSYMKCQILFSGENKKKIISLSSVELGQRMVRINLTLVLLYPDIPAFANSVDPDQLASEEANWSGSALFAIKYNVCESISTNLIK